MFLCAFTTNWQEHLGCFLTEQVSQMQGKFLTQTLLKASSPPLEKRFIAAFQGNQVQSKEVYPQILLAQVIVIITIISK